MLRKLGTVSINQASVEMGDSPIKNWKGSSADWGFFKSKSSNPNVFTKNEKVKFHCYSCPLGCGGICKTKGKFKDTHKPEYETVLSLGKTAAPDPHFQALTRITKFSGIRVAQSWSTGASAI